MTGSQVVALDCAIVVLMNLLPLRLGRECEVHHPFSVPSVSAAAVEWVNV